MFALFIVLKHLLPDTALATFAYILITYHVVLAFKVFTGNKQLGLSLPLWQTLLTHAACVGLLVGLGLGRHTIPFFGIIRYFLPGLAPFEAEWLFSGGRLKANENPDEARIQAAIEGKASPQPSAASAQSASSAPSLYMNSSGDEYNEFLELMRQGKRPYRKPGLSVAQEYERWLAARAKSHPAAPANAEPAPELKA